MQLFCKDFSTHDNPIQARRRDPEFNSRAYLALICASTHGYVYEMPCLRKTLGRHPSE